MKVYSEIDALQKQISILKSEGKTIGFIPTMGALHYGHISLVESAMKQCDVAIVSIFVNPTQFNNSDDLLKYPRTLDSDLALLSSINCSIVFTPSVEEMYPENRSVTQVGLGELAEIMEGKFRPGHFNGVVDVVSRLFEIVQPDKAFFGLKDFQQVSVIRFMTIKLNLPIEIIPCPTLREDSGLAMSSRNIRLSETDKVDSLVIYRSLQLARELIANHSPSEVIKRTIAYFETSKLKLEYFEIVDPVTLKSLEEDWVNGATACIVAYCGDVRLIDNMELV